jgi:hypothetical protein
VSSIQVSSLRWFYFNNKNKKNKQKTKKKKRTDSLLKGHENCLSLLHQLISPVAHPLEACERFFKLKALHGSHGLQNLGRNSAGQHVDVRT